MKQTQTTNLIKFLKDNNITLQDAITSLGNAYIKEKSCYTCIHKFGTPECFDCKEGFTEWEGKRK